MGLRGEGAAQMGGSHSIGERRGGSPIGGWFCVFGGEKTAGGDLPELWRNCPFFNQRVSSPLGLGHNKGLVRPKALRKAEGRCSRQWEERLARRALRRQCLWERGGFSRPRGALAAQRLSSCRWGQWGAAQLRAPGEEQTASCSRRRGKRLVGRGEDPQQQLKWVRHSPNLGAIPLHRWVASVAVGDRPLGERRPARWKGATSAPAVAGKSPSIFWPVGWGRAALCLLLTLGGRKYGRSRLCAVQPGALH